ncbi:MAG: LLM class flavin-dependent oxidoreductase [Actinomycetota bacterium]
MTEHPLRLAVAINGYGLEHDDPEGVWREVLGWEELAGVARLAEELGYESIFAPEIHGWEVFSMLAGFALITERIGLVSGVVPIAARDRERLAMGASSLQELSGGRFTLGVGSRDSVDRTRAALQDLRGLLTHGQGYDPIVGDASETDWFTKPRPVRMFLAALGPRMTALAGEQAHGVILNWATPERVAEARATITERDDFTIAVYVRACLSHADERATGALRVAALRYGAMETYRRQFEAMGVDPSDADAIVAQTCVRGDRKAALERLGEYRDAGADIVVVYPVPAEEAVSSLKGTLMAAAPRS